MIYQLKIEEDAGTTVNNLLKSMLKDGKIDALVAMQETPTGKSAFPTMVSDPDKLHTNVFAPLLPVSTGTVVSHMTKVQGPKKPLAVVLRACELRALVELAKIKQADLDNLILIGVDCLGTFPMKTYSDFDENPTEILLKGEGEEYLRTACLNCKNPVPENADIVIGVYGADEGLFLDARTEKGEGILSDMDLDEAEDVEVREQAVNDVRGKKDETRKEFMEEHADIVGVDKLLEFFDTCVNCHNCMKACPICYCRECLFESSVFDLEANKYMAKAKSKGAFKTPTDSLLFHVTRFNHMILSCVECGLCEQACPSDIPLMNIITSIAENAQREFEYEPGKDPEEEMPMVVYREDEFQDVGEG